MHNLLFIIVEQIQALCNTPTWSLGEDLVIDTRVTKQLELRPEVPMILIKRMQPRFHSYTGIVIKRVSSLVEHDKTSGITWLSKSSLCNLKPPVFAKLVISLS